MKLATLAASFIAVLAATTTAALAQDAPIGDAEPEDFAPQPDAEITPPPPPAATPAPRAPAPRPAAKPARSASDRPAGLTAGIGLGYIIPADIQVPTISSVRFRFSSGLTFEPFVELSRTSTSVDTVGGDSTDNFTDFGLGTMVRYPLASRGRVDFILAGSGLFAYGVDNPDGPNNSVNTTSFALSWGPAIDFWINNNWVVSATTLNPLLLVSSVHTNTPVGDTTTTTTSVSAEFDPELLVLIHLFW